MARCASCASCAPAAPPPPPPFAQHIRARARLPACPAGGKTPHLQRCRAVVADVEVEALAERRSFVGRERLRLARRLGRGRHRDRVSPEAAFGLAMPGWLYSERDRRQVSVIAIFRTGRSVLLHSD